MAPNVTETTPLLIGYVINMPKEKDIELPESESFSQGLSLKELKPFESDPWWQNVRKLMMLIYWASIFIAFAAACMIAIFEHNKGLCHLNQTTALNFTNQSMQSSQGSNATFVNIINNMTSSVLKNAQ